MQEFQHVQDALKEYLTPAMVNQLPKKSILWSQLKKTAKGLDVSGKRVVIPVIMGYPEAVGARAANNYNLPDAQRSLYDQAWIYLKRNYGRIGIDGFSWEASKGSGGWVDLLIQETKNSTAAFAIDIDRQTLMDGLGRLAQVTAATPSGQVITVKNPGGITGDTPFTKFFRKGQVLDIYTAGGSNHAKSVVISAVASTTITVVGTITAVDTDDWIYKEDAYGAGDNIGEMMGINGIISATDVPGTEFEGIDRNTNPEWCAYVAGSIGALTETKIQEALDAIEQRTDGDAPSYMLTTYLIRNKLIDLIRTDRTVTTMKLNGGWTAVRYTGGNVELPLIVHPKCAVGYIYFISTPHIKIYTLKDLTWDDRGGGTVKPIANKDAYESWYKMYSNLGTDCSNAHGVLTGVTA